MRVRVLCSDCGEVFVEPNAVTLRNCIETDEWSYRFRCPECVALTVAPTSRQAALEAATAGATIEHWTSPSPPAPTGPPFTAIDVMALRAALNEPDWFETLLGVDAD